MFLVNQAMEHISIGTAGIIVVLGIIVVFIGLILLNTVAVILETVEQIYTPYKEIFRLIDIFSVVIFTIEYIRVSAIDTLFSCIIRK